MIEVVMIKSFIDWVIKKALEQKHHEVRRIKGKQYLITLRICFADLATISLKQRSHKWGMCLVPSATWRRGKNCKSEQEKKGKRITIKQIFNTPNQKTEYQVEAKDVCFNRI